ncbi:MIP/aquaporin family protein [Bifidobacterium tibiigranuli]|uniref:MIP/aquaporin family protein n=1 Tax=Bifidobacterium tibiigranuli TaxID=2172043 RepID=UPI003AF613DA
MNTANATPAISATANLWLRVAAELLGSFLIFIVIYLAYALSAALYGANLAFIAVATGLVYAIVTFVLGRISVGHFNPAVTIAAMLTSKTQLLDGLLYIIAQVLGGIAAGAVFKSVLPVSQSLPVKLWFTYAANGFESGSVSSTALKGAGVSFSITLAILVEVIAGVLIVAAAMSTLGKDGKGTSHQPWAMGLAYGAGAAFTYPVTGAALNPARATGVAIFAQNQGLTQEPLQQLWVFWIVPVLAAALVALVMVAQELFAKSAATTAVAAVTEPEAVQADAAAAADEGSVEQSDADVRDDQADSQGNANEGIEAN